MTLLKDLIAVANGQQKADLVLKNGQLINVFSGEIYSADVAVAAGYIAGVGDYTGEEEIDLNGRYITPGFIDSHIHIESTLLTPPELAKVIVPCGTTAMICDPHEIANVLGLTGIRYLIDAGKGLPVDMFFAAPSCVPSTELETSGGLIKAADIKTLFKDGQVIRLGEMVNFKGVLEQDKAVMAKIKAAGDAGVEGHAPGLSGKALNAYIAAGIGSDHESVGFDEAREKLKAGMQILVRQGSSAKNLEAILPLITPANSRFFSFCTDDILPTDLAQGHINAVLKRAVELKLDPVVAIQLATINPARFYGLKRHGAIAPGYLADINIISNLEDFKVDLVIKRGVKVASRGKPLFEAKSKAPASVKHTVKMKPFEVDAFGIKAKSDYAKAIELVPGQILTKSIVVSVKKQGKLVVADPASDVLKLAVIERHKGKGNIGLGLVKGFGLKKGALATSVAHDAHNIICVGAADEDMISAVRRVAKLQGGLVVVRGGLVLAELPLPIAGLMSDLPLNKVLAKLRKVEQSLKELGIKVEEPFGLLSFLALPVVPELRLTDMGLVDTNKLCFTELFE
ncbi:MAG: adenine deaminase [Candidatus Saganbacteria bacterium]|nr:adenine deaminase [Candidatus Saganbacteria bacterium]